MSEEFDETGMPRCGKLKVRGASFTKGKITNLTLGYKRYRWSVDVSNITRVR